MLKSKVEAGKTMPDWSWKSQRRIWLATWLAAVVAAGAFGEENWSRFRGPNGSGVAAGVSFAATWADADYQWKVSLPGNGHSSPVAWGDRLFVTTADEQTGELSLIALDAESGETLWSESFASSPHHLHAANSYASSSPTVDHRQVYITWSNGQELWAAALTHAGEEAWSRRLGPLDYGHGFGGSPVVVDGRLIVANDNSGESFVTALDVEAGEPRWRRERAAGKESYATPAVWRGADCRLQIVVHSTGEGMAGLSPQDGDVLWQVKDVFPERCVLSPLVAGGLVFGGTGEGGNGKSFTAVRPPSAAGGEATVAYELSKSLPQVPTPVATDDLLFVWSDRGVASCYDLQTGKLHWTERLGGNYFSSPVIAGDTLYAVAADGEVIAIAADSTFKLLGRSELGEASSATPMIHRGRMYLRGESSLVCLSGEPATVDR
ncbi:MAG TPA: PQQ-binding-like beta-propeller repeat protein [Lacipirellula sp.]